MSTTEKLIIVGIVTLLFFYACIALYFWLYKNAVIQWGVPRSRLEQILLKCKICKQLMQICTHGIPGYDHYDTGSRFCFPRDFPAKQDQTTHP
jgi:hypothetical protein